MAKTTEMVEVPTTSLRPYDRNAKKHPQEQIEKIKNSIEEFGFISPCLIDKENNIIAGHGRVEAARELGMETVPCVYIEGLTEEQRRAYIIADNRLTELGGWDMDLVNQELDELAASGFDVSITGFDWDATARIEITDDGFNFESAAEEKTETRTKPGQIWKLGDHRLMCGDSTSREALDKLMDGALADFVFTDPPYGVAIGSKNKYINEIDPGRGGQITNDIIGDTMEPEELKAMLTEAMTNLREHCKEDASYYVSSPQGGDLGMMMLQMMRDAGLEVRHTLIWVKSTATFSMGRLDYDYRHEPVFYTWTEKHNFYGGAGNTVFDDTLNIDKLTKEELREELRKIRDREDISVIYASRPHSSRLHPTMKPIKLVARFMKNSSREGDTVLDIFGGSGTTLITAEQLHRKCYMMELDPHYCDVIIDRWETFTGRKAEVLNG